MISVNGAPKKASLCIENIRKESYIEAFTIFELLQYCLSSFLKESGPLDKAFAKTPRSHVLTL